MVEKPLIQYPGEWTKRTLKAALPFKQATAGKNCESRPARSFLLFIIIFIVGSYMLLFCQSTMCII